MKAFLSAILCLIFTALLPNLAVANWQLVGKADYNWGPFLVYSVSLYSEDGKYQENQTPIMISFDYAKPVEGKNFAITLVKEMAALNVEKEQSNTWLKQLEKSLPDTSPNDRLSYIALPDNGYFVLNNQVIEQKFSPDFNRTFAEIWLSGKTGFGHLADKLLGKTESNATELQSKPIPVEPMQEDDASPQLPPNYPLENPIFMLA